MDFVGRIPFIFPSLTELTLPSLKHFLLNAHVQALGDVLSQLPNLRMVDLELTHLPTAVAAGLSALPRLDIAIFTTNNSFATADFVPLKWTWMHGVFLALSHLEVTLAYDRATCELLRSIGSTLKTLKLHHSGRHNVFPLVEDVVEAVVTHRALTQLELVDIVTVGRFNWQTIVPVSQCTTLETLTLTADTNEFRATDADVDEFLSRLPRLTNLTIAIGPKRPSAHGRPALTLASLLSAIHHLPLVEFVGLLVDASDESIPNIDGLNRTQHQHLRRLNFYGSSIGSPPAVARFLALIATPPLEIVIPKFDDGWWTQVARLLQTGAAWKS